MKNISIIAFFLLSTFFHVHAQDGVGIGTTSVDGSAILELESADKGLLLTRVADVNDISSPTQGLIAYQTSNASLYLYDGSWVRLNPIPTGGIIMWSGTTPPAGWALCDGNNGTPDLRGRFIVGYHNTDTDYNTVGNTGGEKRHTLTTAEIPAHSHSIPSHNHSVSVTVNPAGSHSHNIHARLDASGGSELPAAIQRTHGGIQGGNGVDISTDPVGTHTHSASASSGYWSGTSGSRGDGSAHENRPPYYVLAFIMKL